MSESMYQYDEIPWPIEGYRDHYPMPDHVYRELRKNYPSIDVEKELNLAYRHMVAKFSLPYSKANFTIFITRWMDTNERSARRTRRWFEGDQ